MEIISAPDVHGTLIASIFRRNQINFSSKFNFEASSTNIYLITFVDSFKDKYYYYEF